MATASQVPHLEMRDLREGMHCFNAIRILVNEKRIA